MNKPATVVTFEFKSFPLNFNLLVFVSLELTKLNVTYISIEKPSA